MDIHELDYMIENPNYMHDFVLSQPHIIRGEALYE